MGRSAEGDLNCRPHPPLLADPAGPCPGTPDAEILPVNRRGPAEGGAKVELLGRGDGPV